MSLFKSFITPCLNIYLVQKALDKALDLKIVSIWDGGIWRYYWLEKKLFCWDTWVDHSNRLQLDPHCMDLTWQSWALSDLGRSMGTSSSHAYLHMRHYNNLMFGASTWCLEQLQCLFDLFIFSILVWVVLFLYGGGVSLFCLFLSSCVFSPT